MKNFYYELKNKNSNFNKINKMFDIKIQEFLTNVEKYKNQNVYEEKKYKLYLFYLLLITEPIVFKSSNYTPNYLDNEDLNQETYFIFENFLKITNFTKQNRIYFKIMIKIN